PHGTVDDATPRPRARRTRDPRRARGARLRHGEPDRRRAHPVRRRSGARRAPRGSRRAEHHGPDGSPRDRGDPPAPHPAVPRPACNLPPPALATAGLLLADGTRSSLSIQRDGRIAGLRALLASADDAAALAAEARWSLAALGGVPSALVVAGADAGPELATALADATRATVVPLAEVAGALPGDVTACAVAAGLVVGTAWRAPKHLLLAGGEGGG